MIGTTGSVPMLSGDFDTRLSLIRQVEQSDIDHLFIADHISFHTGLGMDGIVNAATLAAMSPQTTIFIGVYLLALRHPVPVARQLSSISQSAPGRIILGVGVGGEDRHEMEICGVDPARRGRQTNHCMKALDGLMSGEPVSYDCEFFSFEDALIKPAPTPRIPMIVGGRSDAAIQRTALLGDGWLGVWCSPQRYRAVLDEIDELASARDNPPVWQHGLQIWAGFGDNDKTARSHLASQMEAMYQMPFERFDKYSPFGTPEAVAEFLASYVEQGCRWLNVKPCAASEEAGLEAIDEVAGLLKREFPDLLD